MSIVHKKPEEIDFSRVVNKKSTKKNKIYTESELDKFCKKYMLYYITYCSKDYKGKIHYKPKYMGSHDKPYKVKLLLAYKDRKLNGVADCKKTYTTDGFFVPYYYSEYGVVDSKFKPVFDIDKSRKVDYDKVYKSFCEGMYNLYVNRNESEVNAMRVIALNMRYLISLKGYYTPISDECNIYSSDNGTAFELLDFLNELIFRLRTSDFDWCVSEWNEQGKNMYAILHYLSNKENNHNLKARSSDCCGLKETRDYIAASRLEANENKEYDSDYCSSCGRKDKGWSHNCSNRPDGKWWK